MTDPIVGWVFADVAGMAKHHPGDRWAFYIYARLCGTPEMFHSARDFALHTEHLISNYKRLQRRLNV